MTSRSTPTLSAPLALALLGLAGLALHAPAASAQSMFSVPPSDLSLQLLGRIFGEAPLAWNAAGPLASPLGAIFLAVCTALLSVGVAWFGYNVVRVAVATAEDGQWMGRGFSKVWMPVRFVIGVGMLIPMFPVNGGAWCGAQVAMAVVGKMGIALANAGARAGSNFMTGFQNTTPMMAADHQKLAEAMYESALCMQALNAGQQRASAQGVSVYATPVQPQPISSSTEVGIAFRHGGLVARDVCGRITVSFPQSTTYQLTSSAFNLFGSDRRSQVVSEQQRIRNVTQQALSTMLASATAAANDTITGFESGGTTAVDPARLNAMAQAYTATVWGAAQSAAAAVSAPVTSGIQSEINQKGWIVLGAWFQALASSQNEIGRVINGTASIEGPQSGAATGGYATLYRDVSDAHRTTQAGSQAGTSGDSNKALDLIFGGDVGRDWAARFAAQWSGTSDNSNPVLGMKNTGDWLTGIGATVLAGSTLIKVAADSGSQTLLARGAGLLTAANAPGWIKSALEWLGPMIFGIVMLLFFFGVTLAVYIPMLPFLVWFGGVIGWITVTAEAILAAPLGAFAHLEAEGEGLGQRTQHSYLFLVNMLFRPVLMVMGFFVAMGAVTALGWLLNALFATSMANAQMNTWTGLVQFLGFVFVYWSLALTVVTASFQLIQIIPDVATGWIGHAMGVQLGRDTEDRTKNVFAAAVFRSQGLKMGGLPQRPPRQPPQRPPRQPPQRDGSGNPGRP
jgi:conjugal transfer/type IV secretion protein DotA/TraY